MWDATWDTERQLDFNSSQKFLAKSSCFRGKFILWRKRPSINICQIVGGLPLRNTYIFSLLLILRRPTRSFLITIEPTHMINLTLNVLRNYVGHTQLSKACLIKQGKISARHSLKSQTVNPRIKERIVEQDLGMKRKPRLCGPCVNYRQRHV